MVVKSDKTRIAITVSQETKEKLEILTKSSEGSLSEYVNALIEEQLPNLIAQNKTSIIDVLITSFLTDENLFKITGDIVKNLDPSIDFEALTEDQQYTAIFDYALENYVNTILTEGVKDIHPILKL
jgi:hypothetical protein